MLAFIWMSLRVLAGYLARGIIGSKRHLGFLEWSKKLIEVLFNHLTQRDGKSLALKLASGNFKNSKNHQPQPIDLYQLDSSKI